MSNFIRATAAMWVLMVGASAGYADSGTGSGSTSRPTIGVSLPLTGDSASEGKDIQSMLQFANEELAGGKYKLIVEDDRCSDKAAVTIAQKFTSVDHVNAVVGYACSGAVLAAAPIYEERKTVTIAVATGEPSIALAGEYIYRTIPSLGLAAAKLYDHAASHYRKIGMLSEETAYAQGLAHAFSERNREQKLEIVADTFLPETSDFRSLLTKMRGAGVEAIFLNPQAEPGLIAMYRQLLELGWKVPVYGTYYPGFAEFRRTFGNAADGIVFADLPGIESALGSDGPALYSKYQKANGVPQSSQFYFVTTLAAFEAIHEALSSGGDPKQYLDTHTFKGFFGSFRFDEKGDAQGDTMTFVLKTLRNGAPALLE